MHGNVDNRPSRIVLFARLFKPRRRWQLGLILVMTVAGAFADMASIGIIVPFLMLVSSPTTFLHLPIIRDFAASNSLPPQPTLIFIASGVLVVVALLSTLMRIAIAYVTNRFVAALMHELASKVFDHVLGRPYLVHIRDNSSTILAAFEKVNMVSTYVVGPALTALGSIIVGVGILILLLIIAPDTAIIAGISISGIYVLMGLVFNRRLFAIGRSMSSLVGKRIKLIQEALGSFRDVVLDRAQATFGWQFSVIDIQQRRQAAIAVTIGMAPRFIVEGLAIILIVILAIYYLHSYGSLVAAFPILGGLALGAQRLMPLAQNINTAYAQYVGARANIDDILTLLSEPSAVQSVSVSQSVDFSASISFDNVNFAYDGARAVLSGVSTVIPKGARTGIIGTTGSGKSTFVDVLMGLLPPSAGRVLIDGRPLSAENVAGWQCQIAHIPQSIFLLDTTVAANIAFARPEDRLDMELVRQAARRACIDDFIQTLPKGYETEIGERGVRLSGGQRQRIGIARALYKDARILIMDEATSALDENTEREVIQNIESCEREITIIMISHRLSTIANCDLVLQFEEGKLVAQGRFEDVVLASSTPATASRL